MLNTNIINNYLRTETQRLNYSKAEKLHTHQVGAIQGLAEYVNTVSVNEFVEQLYPVGSIYITENTELPESLQNNKSWEKFKTEDGKNYFKRVDSPLLNLFVEIIDESHNIISIDFGTINVPIMFENNKPTIGSSFAKEILEHISQKYIEVKNIEQDAFSYDDEKAIFRVTTSDLSEPETTVGYYKYNITSLGKSLETPQISVVDKSNDFASAEKVRPFLNFFNNKGVLTHVENISGLYQDCTALETIDISNWYTIHIKNISNMFNGCAGLTTVTGLDKIDFSEVSDMSGIFNGCTGLTGTFDLSFINAPVVTTIADMFNGCTGLTTITLPTNKLPMVKDCSNVFNGCEVLETINNLSSIITDTTETVAYMFAGCAAIVAIDFTGIDTSNVTAMNHMFDGCAKITFGSSINWDVNKVENCEYMFNGCKAITNLTNINLSFANTKTSEAMFAESGLSTVSSLSIINSPVNKNISSMFAGCESLTTVSFNGTNLSAVTDMANAFKGCTVLNTVTLTGVDLSKVTNISNTFNGCSALTTLDFTGMNLAAVTDFEEAFTGSGLETVTLNNTTLNKDLFNAITDVTSVTTLNTTGMIIKGNTAGSDITDCSSLFADNTNLETIDVSGLKNLATNTNSMFKGCTALTTITGLDEFITDTTTDISNMFNGCSALTTISMKNCKFVACENSTDVFTGSGLTSVTLDGSTMTKTAIGMFKGIIGPLTTFSLVNVTIKDDTETESTSLEELFNGWTNIQSIDISGMVKSSVININSMFNGCSALTTIVAKNCDFTGCNTHNTVFTGSGLTSVTLDESTMKKDIITLFKDISTLTTLSLVNVTVKDSDGSSDLASFTDMFDGWTNIQSIDISEMIKSSVTTITDMIKGCSKLTTITAHNEDFSGATGAFIGSGNSALETVDLSESTIKKETITSLNAVSFVGEDSLINISQCTFSSPATDTLASLFNNFGTVKNINMSNITVASSPLSIESAFSGCSAVKSIDITLPDSTSINTVTNAFSGCAALTSVKCTNTLYQTLNTALTSGPGGSWSWSDGVATKSG